MTDSHSLKISELTEALEKLTVALEYFASLSAALLMSDSDSDYLLVARTRDG